MNNRLRIALFTYATKPRGSVVHTLELAEALHQLGHEVCIYALDKQDAPQDPAHVPNKRGFDRPYSCSVQLIPAQPVTGDIDRLIQQRIQEFVRFFSDPIAPNRPLPYDCYHAQDCISANALLQLRQQGQIPHFVRTVHHIDAFSSPYLQACQEKSIAEPDLCLCVSAHWQTQLRQQYNIEAPRVINGVDRDRFVRPDALNPSEAVLDLKQRLNLLGNPIYLTVGGIEPRKNSIALLQAFAQALIDFPQAQLVIAGGATLFDYQDYRHQFFAEVDRLGVSQSLVLPGIITEADLPLLYHAADAFVFPSLKEGWGLVVLEAIASGLPVITAQQPPFTEFLSDQQALLVNPQDVEAIAQAMRQIMQPALAKSLVAESQMLCNIYTWENSARMHINAYHQLIEDKPLLKSQSSPRPPIQTAKP
ncbi:MAG: MSMEG_0565 family glycosyltransferase [Oscillatoriophycideae cyanobacterium NC_groundwater_1537_Pr4_S-0.65um_50_18]|nr:MSMEG_0565 family glycosyltransferase [Oscillatoriophycideae cyanobacterium NC_groundwater_1537_Pr4_S-0.65um_50_18]